MDQKINAASITFFCVAVLITFLAYLIKYKKQAYLISGYNEDQVMDKDGLCNWFGGVFIYLGIFTFLASFMIWWLPAQVKLIVFAFGIGTVVACILAITGSKKYKKQF